MANKYFEQLLRNCFFMNQQGWAQIKEWRLILDRCLKLKFSEKLIPFFQKKVPA